MDRTSEFFKMFFQEKPNTNNQPQLADMATRLNEIREREQTQHCIPRARLFREASSGWNPGFQREGHASYCAECESAAFIALRKRRPGLWIVAGAERNIEVRPVWWTRAAERHLAEAPSGVRLLAQFADRADALKKSLDAGLAWALESRQGLKEGAPPKRPTWRSFSPEDGLLVTELRPLAQDETSKDYVLSATSLNLKKAKEREGLRVSVSIFGRNHRLDKTLLLESSGSLLQGKVPITPEELIFLDPDIDKGGLPGIALLEPELLPAETSSSLFQARSSLPPNTCTID